MMLSKIVDENRIEVYDLTQFDLDAIMHSGQVFRFFEIENGYALVSGKNFAKIFKEGDIVVIDCDDANYWFNYFDLNTDYNKIKKDFAGLEKIKKAIELGGGIRILRANFYEMLISFIISANNNIKRFTKTLNMLSEEFGEKLESGFFSFPTIEQLKKATDEDFKRLGAGYRSAYLVEAVKQVENIDLEKLEQLSTAEVFKELLKIKGVGKKVCGCVALFSGTLHRLEICPVDVWMEKALSLLDNRDRWRLLNSLYAGVAQQYIFYVFQHLRKKF